MENISYNKNIMHKKSKLSQRSLPDYSKGEEIANMVTHIVGGVFGLASLVLCVIFSALRKDVFGIVCGALYGVSMVIVYVISSVYHGLDPEKAHRGKKVMQVIDHCDIYGLIIGTFAPIALTRMREQHPIVAWVSFGIVLLTGIVGLVFTSIDMKKFRIISYSAYFVAGWSVLATIKTMLDVYSLNFVILLIIGGLVYTLGMIFFWLQTKHYKYCHSVFHLFILSGSVIQFIAIFKYCIL